MIDGVVVFLLLSTCHSQLNLAHIAQSVEHFLGKEEVTGSNPVMSSRYIDFCKPDFN